MPPYIYTDSVLRDLDRRVRDDDQMPLAAQVRFTNKLQDADRALQVQQGQAEMSRKAKAAK